MVSPEDQSKKCLFPQISKNPPHRDSFTIIQTNKTTLSSIFTCNYLSKWMKMFYEMGFSKGISVSFFLPK